MFSTGLNIFNFILKLKDKKLLTLLKGVIYVEKSQVVSIDMGKSHLGLVGLLFHLIWTNKTLGD